MVLRTWEFWSRYKSNTSMILSASAGPSLDDILSSETFLIDTNVKDDDQDKLGGTNTTTL